MKLKKLFSVILMAALLCMSILPVSAAIDTASYSLSETRYISADGPLTVQIAIADEGDTQSYDKITAYVKGQAVASADRVGDAPVKIVFPADTFSPGVNTVTYKATLGDELYKSVTKKVTAYKETDATLILGTDYDNLTSTGISGWETKNPALGADIFRIVGDNDATKAVTIETDGTNKYLKYLPDGSGNTFVRLSWTNSDTYTDGILKLSADVYVPDAETVPKTNIYCYTGSHQFDAASYLKAGQWNKISWLFNISKKSYSMYVDGVGGTGEEWSVGVPAELSLATKELRSEIYVNSGKYIYIDNLKLEHMSGDHELFNISAPKEGVNTAPLSIRPYMSGEVKTYVDGTLLSTDAVVAEKEIIKDIDVATFGVGVKDIRAVATFDNGETYIKYARVNLKNRVESGIGSASSSVIDFNDLNEDCTEQIAAKLTSNVADKAGSVTRIAGKSGQAGDYAALFNFGTVEAQDYDGGIVSINGTDNQRTVLKAKGGKFVVEFDMMFFEGSPNMYLKLPFGLWGPEPKSQCFMDGGTNKLRNTDTAIIKDNWHSFKMVYDIDNNLWSVWFDNTLQTLANAKEDYTTYYGDIIRFRFGRRPNGYKNQLALDNIRVYHVEESAKVASLTLGGEEVSDYAIAYGNQSVNVTLDKAYAAEGKVYCDGVLAEDFAVTTSDNVTYVAQGNFKANHQYKVAIGNITVPLYIMDENGIYLKIFDGKVADGKFTADIECYSAVKTSEDIKVITATYNGDRVTAVNYEDLAAGAGLTSVRKQLTYVGDVTMGKVVIWNNMIPLANAPEFTPAQ